MESTISYGYPYASARIQTGTNCSENKSTPTSKAQTKENPHAAGFDFMSPMSVLGSGLSRLWIHITLVRVVVGLGLGVVGVGGMASVALHCMAAGVDLFPR